MEAAFIEVAVIKTGEEDPDACLKGVAEKDDETISVFLEPQRGSDNNNESPTTASVVSVAVSETGGECCKVFSHHQSSLGQKLKFTNTKLTLRYQTGEILSLNIKSDSLFSIISETFARVVHNKNYSTKHRGIYITPATVTVHTSKGQLLSNNCLLVKDLLLDDSSTVWFLSRKPSASSNETVGEKRKRSDSATDNGNSQHCKKGDSNSGELELLEKLTLFVNSYESIDSKVYGKGLVVYQSSTNFISSLYAKQRKGGISCPHTYYQRSSPLDKKRIWLTLYHLIYSDFQRDVLWTGAHGCGLSFAVTAMHMECLDLRKAGVFDELLLRIDGELFSIRLSDCAKVKASDSSASSASSSYSMPSPHQSGGAYEGISDPLLFTVSHVPLKSSSLDELSNHLDNEQYENKVVILILEFLPSELERQVFICFARTDVKVRILYVSSSREHYSKFRGLFVLNIPTFLVEPMSDHELMESAAAQLDLDRSDCHWADDGNGGQLDRAQALKQCRERQLVVGNIPRYVFAHQHVFETREYQLHNSRDFQLEEFGILRDLTFVPERSSAFIAPMFRFGVTIPMVSLLNEYAAPELFAAQCQEPLDQDITIHWHSGSITMIFVSETARKHVMKHVTTEKHIRILNDLGLLNPHEMQLVRTALLMRYPLPSFIVEQYRVSDWKFYQDPGPHTLLYCDTDSGCTSVRLPTVEMFNKIRCCIREEDFENDTLQGQGRSANTLQPGVLYRSNQFASSLTMTEYVYSDREGGIEPMATECHHHHHHVYYVQVSRNSPAEHRIRMRDIQVVFDSLKLGDVVNAAYKLVFVYVTDWCHADITGLAFECVVMNGEKRNFGLLEMQAMDSGTVFEGVRDPVGMANRMESIIVTACFHPNTWKGAIQSQQEGPVEYKHCLSYIQG